MFLCYESTVYFELLCSVFGAAPPLLCRSHSQLVIGWISGLMNWVRGFFIDWLLLLIYVDGIPGCGAVKSGLWWMLVLCHVICWLMADTARS
jgi:hypothetical protein